MADSMDLKIKNYLEQTKKHLKSPSPNANRLDPGPTPEEYYLFLEDRLSQEAEKRVLEYLKTHPEAKAMIQTARGLLSELPESEHETVSQDLVERTKGLFARNKQKNSSSPCPHCGGRITPFKSPLGRQKFRNAVWAALSVACFTGSFLVRPYFFQFLAAFLFFGFRWIVDQRSTKTQILIYKALRESGPEDLPKGRDLHQSSSHL